MLLEAWSTFFDLAVGAATVQLLVPSLLKDRNIGTRVQVQYDQNRQTPRAPETRHLQLAFKRAIAVKVEWVSRDL